MRYLIVILMFTLLINCSDRNQYSAEFAVDYNILYTTNSIYSYNINEEKLSNVINRRNVNRLYFSCEGSSDTCLLFSRSPESNDYSSLSNQSKHPVYKYSKSSRELSLIDVLDDSLMYCIDMDYCRERGQYIFYGKYNNERGIFLLDTSLSKITDIMLASKVENDSLNFNKDIYNIINNHQTNVYFLNEENIVMSNSYINLLVNLNTKKVTQFTRKGKIIAISPNKNILALESPDYSTRKDLYNIMIINIPKDKVIGSIFKNPEIYSSCFSHDNKIFTFTQRGGILSDRTDLFIYDIENNVIFSVKYPGGKMNSIFVEN